MSFGGLGSSMPGRSSTAGGWPTGFSGPQPSRLQQDEALFNSLFPISGMVTGDHVKSIFEKSGLPPSKLAQIWCIVDSDKDGKINKAQFCNAMTLIRQAQKEGGSMSPALGGTTSMSHSWSTPLAGTGFKPTSSLPATGFGSTPSSGVGYGVSLSAVSEGWTMKVQDKRKYVMQFNTIDKNKTGFLSGEDVRPFLTKSSLSNTILAKIWELADFDKDGRLSADEFAIALHLLEKAKAGLTLPSTLPAELYPGPTKFHTVDRATSKASAERKTSVPDHKTSVTGEENQLSFEDKRKVNFEAGRLELDRRRRARQEQQERVAAEKERKRREEEERRLQQEREAELARQAELERQHRKALEIEKERERQMQKLVLQREAEQRELERRRKEEWARKRQQELEGHRDRERKSLISLQVQCEELDKELQYLNQRKVGIAASAQRQKSLCVEFSASLRSLRLSHDVRRAELTKLQSELNGFQSQLSSLQHHRKELQQVLQTRNPELATHQHLRQQLKDTVIGLAASLAGLRPNMAYNSQTGERLKETYKKHLDTLKEMKGVYRLEEVKTRELRVMVLTRKRVFEEQQRKQREEEQRRTAEVERAKKETERIEFEMEQRARKEARLAKIKRDQEMAFKKAALDSVVADLNVARSVPSSTSITHQSSSGFKPVLPPKPADISRDREAGNRVEQRPAQEKSVQEKDQEVMRKVQELQQRKAVLQKQQKDSPATKKKAQPDKPPPFVAHKKQKEKPLKSKEKLSAEKEDTLLDLMSSWDQGGPTSPSVINFQRNTSQILQPMTKETESEPPPQETAPPTTATPTETSTESSIVRIREKPEPIKMHSVARLSQLFEKGLPSQDYAKVQATSESRATAEQASGTADVTMETEEQTQLRVIYDFTASDAAEVSIKEGDTVTFVPGHDTSPGWAMVRLASEEQGWVPELYLERPGQEVGGDKEEEPMYDEPTNEQATSPPPVKAIVKFSWSGSKDNHLSLKRGAIVSVYQQSEKWWSGELDGKVGWFPKTFVKIIDEQENQHQETMPATGERQSTAENPSREETESVASVATGGGDSSQFYEAVYDYKGERDGDLAFNTGDIIQVTTMEGEWWTGILNGVKGVFPCNYVQLKPDQQQPPMPVSPSGSQSSLNPEASITTHSKPLIAKVVAAFHTEKDGQLNLVQGELVKVRKQASNGWWEGELQSRGKQRTIGWFPANRVELLSLRRHNTTSVTSLPGGVGGAAHLGRARSPLLDVLEDTKPASTQNLVLALYTYTAQSSDELSFHKGSVITVLSQEGEWWKGEINGQTGLFPSNYVQNLTEPQSSTSEPTRWADSVSPDILEAVSDQERKRQEAIFEMLTSERHYVDSLKLVKEVFFDPMAENNVLTAEELSKVFVNWDDLITCSSELLSAFLVRLRTSGAVVRSIGDILVIQIPNLTPHIRWCSCQLNACTLLQQKSSDSSFKEFEQRCAQDSRTGGLPLSSFLLKPMQRVTKYPLLVKRILDYTPKGHMDREDISLALKEAETLCDQVNEGVRQKENTEHLEWLQSHVQFTLEEKLVFNSQTNFMGSRRLLHWGKLFKIRGAKDVNVFLFNDFILILKPKLFLKAATSADLELFGKNEFQMYRKPFLLDGVRMKKATNEQTAQHGGSVFLLITASEEREILLKAESDRMRDQWMQKITKASLAYITTKKKQEREAQEKQMRTLKESVGMLSVTVVEACDLLAKDPNGRSDPFCVLKFGDHQEQNTPVIHSTLNPKWNYKMQFSVHDLNTEVLELTVFDKDLFSPNDFLGSARLTLKDLLRDGDSPWSKRMLLVDVANGEIELKIDLKMNKKNLLL